MDTVNRGKNSLNMCSTTFMYVLVEGRGVNKIVPPLVLSLPSWEEFDPFVKSYNHISDLVKIYETGYGINGIFSTPFSVEFPCLLENHIFVLLPLAWHSDDKFFVRYVYVIKVDEDSSIHRHQIESHLRNLDQSLPPFQSIRDIRYDLNVHRSSGFTDFELPRPDEYAAGAILFLQESNERDEFEETPVSASRNVSMLLRNYPTQREPQLIGSTLIAVLPSTTCSTVVNDYPTDTTEEVHGHHKQPVIEASGSDNSTNEEPLEETLADVNIKGGSLVVNTGDVPTLGDTLEPTNADNPPLPLPVQQEEGNSVSSQTTLSTIRSNNSYVYNEPTSVTEKSSYYQPSFVPTLIDSQYCAPKRSPLASDVNFNTQVPTHYSDLPMSIKDCSHGKILYANESFSKLFPSGQFGDFPKFEAMRKSNQLGKGGNGKVYQYNFFEKEVALKFTKYRKNEIDIWRQLSHANVVPIIGAIVVDHDIKDKRCCQIMPRMTGSLRDELERIGGGIGHALQAGALSESSLRHNLSKIFCYILRGLDYLLDNKIVFQDLKDSNILIYKTCGCDNIYICDCFPGYSVELSDFDSVRKSSSDVYKTCDVHKATVKSSVDCAKVLGTGEYRAPEKFLDHCGCDGVATIGWWIDIWSFGTFIINQLFGINREKTDDIKKEVNTFCGYYNMCGDIPPSIIELQMKSFDILFYNSQLIKDVVRLAWKCLKADCSQRLTPKQLLNDPLLRRCNESLYK